MTPQEQTQLAQKFALYAAYYKTQLPDAVLKMYAADLNDLSFAEVERGMETYRKNPKNRVMPLPAQIRDIVQPTVDTDSAAREVSAKITQAIVKFGSWRGEDAKAFIGPVGWSIVQSYGGWSSLCEKHGLSIDPGQFTAQARDLAKGRLTHSSAALDYAIQLPHSDSQTGLSSAREILQLVTAKPETT